MKQQQKAYRRLSIVLILMSATLFYGCGQAPGVGAAPPIGVGAGACAPINAPIGFTAANAQYSATNLAAPQLILSGVGAAPAPGVAPGVAPGMGIGANNFFSRMMDFGQLSFTVASAANTVAQPICNQFGCQTQPNGFIGASAATVTGTIALSPTFQTYLCTQAQARGIFSAACSGQFGFGGFTNPGFTNPGFTNPGFNNPGFANNANICVSGASMHLVINPAAPMPEMRITSVTSFRLFINLGGQQMSYNAQY